MARILPPQSSLDPVHTKKSVDSASGMAYEEENGVKRPLPGDVHPGTRASMFLPTAEQIEARKTLEAGGHRTEPLGFAHELAENPETPEEKSDLQQRLASEAGMELDPEDRPMLQTGKVLEGVGKARLGGTKKMSEEEMIAHFLNETTDFASHQLTSGDASGYNWYDTNIKHLEKGIQYLTDNDPTLAPYKGTMTGPRMVLFKTLLGMFSPQNNPVNNTKAALAMMRRMAKINPESPFSVVGEAEPQKLHFVVTQKTGDLLGNLVKSLGEEGAASWLLQDHSLDELKQVKPNIKQQDLPTHPSEGNTGNIGAYVFGPKVGSFIANMNGHHEHLTKDSWFTRTWGRIFGKLIEKGDIKALPKASERRLMNRAAAMTAKSLGLTVDEFQAVLWYAEQKLWRNLGHTAQSYSFVDGINHEISKAGLPPLPETSQAGNADEERRKAAQRQAISRRREESLPFSRGGTHSRYAAESGLHEDLGEPNEHLRQLAETIKGGPLHEIPTVTALDPQRHMKVADAYAGMKHDPQAVRSSYDAMKRDILHQYNNAARAGYQMDFSENADNPPAHEMMSDIRGRKYLPVFLGGDLPPDHPLSEVEPTTGRSYNELFRAVHDLFGHAIGGHTFSPVGEENAFRTHAALFSPEAFPALANETVGQNSLMHYGPHMRNAQGQLLQENEPGYLPRQDRPYSEQKAGLLPSEILEGLRADVMPRAKPVRYAMDGSRGAMIGSMPTKPLTMSVGGVKVPAEAVNDPKHRAWIQQAHELHQKAQEQELAAKQAAQAKPDDTMGERIKGTEAPPSTRAPRVPTWNLGEALNQRTQTGPPGKQPIPYATRPVQEQNNAVMDALPADEYPPEAGDHFQDAEPGFVNWVANHPLMKPFNWLGRKVDKYILLRKGIRVRYSADPNKLASLFGPEFAQWVTEKGLQPSYRKQDNGDFRWNMEVDPTLYEGYIDPLAKSRIPKEIFHHLPTNPNIGQPEHLHVNWSRPHETPQAAYSALYQAWNKERQSRLSYPSKPVDQPAQVEPPPTKLSRAGIVHRYASATFASPNTENDLPFQSALERLRSPAQKAFRELADHVYKQLGIHGTPHDAIGDWSDGAENSLVHVLDNPGDANKMRYAAAWLGLLANQKSVLHFQEGEGPDSLYEMDVPSKSIEAVRASLDQHGIKYRTLIPGAGTTKVMLYDQGRSLRPQVEQFAGEHNATIRESTGKGEFIGDNSDQPTRSKARANYRSAIESYESSPGSSTVRPGNTQAQPVPTRPAQLSRRDKVIRFMMSSKEIIEGLRTKLRTAGSTNPGRSASPEEYGTRQVLADALEEEGSPEANFHRWVGQQNLPEKQYPQETAESWAPGEGYGKEKRQPTTRTEFNAWGRPYETQAPPNLKPLIIHVKDPEAFRSAVNEQRIQGRTTFPLAPLDKTQFPTIPAHGRPVYWVGPNGESLRRATVSRIGQLEGAPNQEHAYPSEDLGTHWQVHAHESGDQSGQSPDYLRNAYYQGWSGNGIDNAGPQIASYYRLGIADREHLRRYGHSAPGVVSDQMEHQLAAQPGNLRSSVWNHAILPNPDKNNEDRLVTPGHYIATLLAQRNQGPLALTRSNQSLFGNGPVVMPDQPDRLTTYAPLQESLFEEARRRYHDLLRLRHTANLQDFQKILKHVVNENVPKGATPEEVIQGMKDRGLPFADQLEPHPHIAATREAITPGNVQLIKSSLPVGITSALGKTHQDFIRNYYGMNREQRNDFKDLYNSWAQAHGLPPYPYGTEGPFQGGFGLLSVLDRIRELTGKKRPRKLARIQAPPGGLIVRGLFYQGGKWVPVQQVTQASQPQATVPTPPAATRAGLLQPRV